jgi:hypothetical protein
MLKMIRRKWVLRGWRKIARDRDACKLILEEAKVLHGPHSQSRREEIVNLDWLKPRYSLCVMCDQIRIRFLRELVKIHSPLW